MTNENKALSLGEVKHMTSLSKTTIYRLIKDGQFPKPVKITARRVVWRAAEIKDWLEQKA